MSQDCLCVARGIGRGGGGGGGQLSFWDLGDGTRLESELLF